MAKINVSAGLTRVTPTFFFGLLSMRGSWPHVAAHQTEQLEKHLKETTMRSSVLLFASSLALASAQADEMAKQGEESSTIYYVILSSTPDAVEWAGIRRIDSGDARFDKMGVRCTARGFESGKCTLSDSLGDEIFTVFEPRRFHYAGGTGDYAGISGEGEWRCEHPSSPDPNVALIICTQKSSWKLP